MTMPTVSIPLPADAGTAELIRMIAARKGDGDARSAALSTFLNPFLALCLRAAPAGGETAAPFAADIRDRYTENFGGPRDDNALRTYLSDQADDDARRKVVAEYFLPLRAHDAFPLSPPEATAAAFQVATDYGSLKVNGSDAFEWDPETQTAKVPEAFVGLILNQILVGRHGRKHLELRRVGVTHAEASDAAIGTILDVLARIDNHGMAQAPFLSRALRQSDFAASSAYAHMMELGFSREEMLEVLQPWTLVN